MTRLSSRLIRPRPPKGRSGRIDRFEPHLGHAFDVCQRRSLASRSRWSDKW